MDRSGIVALDAVFPDVVFETWKDCARLVAHVQALEPQIAKLPEPPVTAARLLNQTGYYLDDQGRYPEAEPLYVRSLSIYETQLGAAHPDVATSLNNLAGLYESQGRYSEAEPLYVRSLSIRETQLGVAHPDTAISQQSGNLAGVYESQGCYDKAEPLRKKALEIHEQQLGESHPHTATSLNNLAGLYESQGRYSEAEPLYLRAVEIFLRSIGSRIILIPKPFGVILLSCCKGRSSQGKPRNSRQSSKDNSWRAPCNEALRRFNPKSGQAVHVLSNHPIPPHKAVLEQLRRS